MVVCGPRNNYASRNSSSHYRRLGDRRARRLLLEVDPIRTECRKRVYALPSAVVGFTNSKMRPMRVDRMPSMLGERPELPALQGDQAAGGTRCPSPAQGLTLNSTKSGSRHLSQSARLRCIVNPRAERNPPMLIATSRSSAAAHTKLARIRSLIAFGMPRTTISIHFCNSGVLISG